MTCSRVGGISIPSCCNHGRTSRDARPRVRRLQKAHAVFARCPQTGQRERQVPRYQYVCPLDVPNSHTPHTNTTSSGGTLLLALPPVIVGIRTEPNNLLPNVMLQPFDDAPNSFGSQSDGRQGSNLFSAHSLPEVEPENHTIALLVGSVQAMLQVFIDFLLKNSGNDFFFTPKNLLPRLGVDIARGNMGFVAAG